jgi:hypothetical protein
MRPLSLLATCTLVLVIGTGGVGCNKGKTGEGEGGKKLTVTPPGNTNVEQGASKDITVKINREKFTEPVDISFSGMPEKVTLEGGQIAKDVNEGKFVLKADAAAPPVDGKEVTVTAKGGGITQTATFKVGVEKKK